MIASYLNIQKRLMNSSMNVIVRKRLMNSSMRSPAGQYSTITQYCAVHNIMSSVNNGNNGDNGDNGNGLGLLCMVSIILCFMVLSEKDDVV